MLLIGILGAADIAPRAVIHPARRRDDATVLAVAARSTERAVAYAREHFIPVAYGSYEALLADPRVDLVYNALPPSLHAEWSMRAMGSGKHVLCEKPFTMNAEEARAVTSVAERTGRRVIEAHHDRYHPLQAAVREVVVSGRLGTIRAVRTAFLTSNPFTPSAFRHDPEHGGGAFMDLGTYSLQWVRSALDAEPEVVSATATLNPLGADSALVAELVFPDGVVSTVEASMNHPGVVATIDIVGTAGTLHAGNMAMPHVGHRITETIDGLERTRTVAGRESYDHQLEAVLAGLTSGEPLLTEGQDPILTMEAIDRIYAAAGLARQANQPHQSDR